MRLIEANVDAIPGPTHLFSGLGVGNLASKEHRETPSHPRRAALENLRKAELVASLGIPQFVWLPPRRPVVDLLSDSGFHGSTLEQVESAYRHAPQILHASLSSAFMWAANSGTFSPAVDCGDGCSHFTPANLISSLHRSTECKERASDIAVLFSEVEPIVVHAPLPRLVPMRDEGAANHMRLSDASGMRAINVFIYGVDDRNSNTIGQPKFYPRQTRSSVEAIARLHQLDPDATVMIQQHPAAISAGAFHNDVIATSHRNLLVYHEKAFQSEAVVEEIHERFTQIVGDTLVSVRVSESELPLGEAVKSYLMNSQILTPDPDQSRMVLVSPKQCESNAAARGVIEQLIRDPDCPIEQVHFVSLDQSMSGGGGPACVRLRLPLPQQALEAIPARAYRLTEDLTARLRGAIEQFYPERIMLQDFLDPNTLRQASVAWEALQGCVK